MGPWERAGTGLHGAVEAKVSPEHVVLQGNGDEHGARGCGDGQGLAGETRLMGSRRAMTSVGLG